MYRRLLPFLHSRMGQNSFMTDTIDVSQLGSVEGITSGPTNIQFPIGNTTNIWKLLHTIIGTRHLIPRLTFARLILLPSKLKQRFASMPIQKKPWIGFTKISISFALPVRSILCLNSLVYFLSKKRKRAN